MAADSIEYQRYLGEIRARLDALDEQLVDLLAVRGEVIAQVVKVKTEHGLGPVDLQREKEMLARIETLAETRGLDPRVARRVLEAVIEAFTAVESEHLTHDDH